MSHTAYLWNHMTYPSDLLPIELYTGNELDTSNLLNENTWGYPAYVLDLKLQDGKKLPK